MKRYSKFAVVAITFLAAACSSAALFLTGCESRSNLQGGWDPPQSGDAADPCPAVSPCDVSYASDVDGGACITETVPTCAICVVADGTVGTSRDDGACCTGCWAGNTCRPVPDEYACGKGGGLCTPCNGTQMCIDGACSWPPS